MAIQVQGDTGIVARVDQDRRAQRVVLNPDSGAEVLGHYLVAEMTGVVATPGALAEVFQFRNVHATNLIVIERVSVTMAVAAAVTVAQEMAWDLIRSTSWSAAGTGGSTPTPGKRKTTMATSIVPSGDIRIASTAALGAGTKTLDTWRSGSGPGPLTNAVGASGPTTYMPEDDLRYPVMILGQNEGFSIRNVIALASGSARFHVRCAWREVSSY